MTAANDDPKAALRRSVYWLLILLGTAVMLGRILAVDAIDRAAVQKYRIKKGLNRKEESLRQRGLEGERLEKALQVEETRLREAIQMERPFLSANDRS